MGARRGELSRARTDTWGSLDGQQGFVTGITRGDHRFRNRLCSRVAVVVAGGTALENLGSQSRCRSGEAAAVGTTGWTRVATWVVLREDRAAASVEGCWFGLPPSNKRLKLAARVD